VKGVLRNTDHPGLVDVVLVGLDLTMTIIIDIYDAFGINTSIAMSIETHQIEAVVGDRDQ
jgi:hypothetical protein